MSNIILPDNNIILPEKQELILPTDTIIDINQIAQSKEITENDMGNAGFKNPKAVEDLKYIIKDIMSGDPEAAKKEEYKHLNLEQIKIAIQWLYQQGLDDATLQLLLEKPYLLTFKDRPPTPEEFLTSKYIGSQAESVWWPVRKNFLQFFDPLQPYRTAVLNPSIGSGKSTFTMLALLYIACHFALMRDPWKFFNKSRTTVFVIALCAVTQGKAKEIYNEPIRQLIESASYWKWCRTHQEMLNEEKHLQESDSVDYIPWTTACDGVFQTGNGLNWKTASGDSNIIGLNILTGAMTEINFFLEAGKGWTPDKVYRFFSKLKERISNRFQSNYYARFILDSSPSTLEDPIQNWMTYDAPENPSNYIWRGSRWALYPGEFPKFCDVENINTLDEKITEHHNFDVGFQLFKGGSGKPPVVCETESEASQFEAADLIWCPKEQVTKNGTASFLGKAKENPLDFLKDWCGEPSGTPDRLFYRDDWIEDCFDNGLKNMYGSIVALADEQPEHLIWNQIQHQFFYKVMNRYYFYYEPNVPRVVSVDQSKSRDCTCISMSHIEKDPNRIDEHTRLPMTVYVTDFTIMLVPKGGHINLDAIKFFIYDLKTLGGINLRHVSFDGWQSDPARQFLSRAGIQVDYVSVDKLPEPYYTYYDLVTHGRWHCGKNIFVKNNMKSLHEVRRKQTGTVKIDHFEGDLDYEWEKGNWKSNVATGYNAKDATDAITGNIWLMNLYSNEFIPQKFFYKDAQLERTVVGIEKKNKDLLNSMNLV